MKLPVRVVPAEETEHRCELCRAFTWPIFVPVPDKPTKITLGWHCRRCNLRGHYKPIEKPN